MSDKSILINEQQYLSCILNNPSLIKNEEFNYLVNDISRDIFTTLKKLYSQGVSFTSSTVVSECLKINKDITVEIVNGLKDKVGKECQRRCRTHPSHPRSSRTENPTPHRCQSGMEL